jgi:hypothetical protein
VKIIETNFIKNGNWTGFDCGIDPVNYNSLSTLSKINPKLVCCPEKLSVGKSTQITDILLPSTGLIQCLEIGEYLERQDISNLPRLHLKAKQEIVIEAGITYVKNITFSAPKILIKNSSIAPQRIYPGAKFNNTVDCPFGFRENDPEGVLNLYNSPGDMPDNLLINPTLKGNTNIDNSLIGEEQYSNGILKLSPNPSNGKFIIDIQPQIDLSDLNIDILDFSGKTILHYGKINRVSNEYDLSKYANGMYIIKVNKKSKPVWFSKLLKTE